jgi:predicted  nucleic acid-binding Zn-ribbon protein
MEREIVELQKRIADLEERLEEKDNEIASLKSDIRNVGRDGTARAGVQVLAITVSKLIDALDIDEATKAELKSDIEQFT